MSGFLQMRVFSLMVTAISIAGLAYIYVVPPQSMLTDRNGVPHFSPPIINPETGDALDLRDLVRHYKGE